MGWTNPNTQQVQPISVQGSVSGAPVTTLPAGGNITLVPRVDVTGFASYDLNMYGYAQNPGASGSVLVFFVQLQWYDDTTSNIPVFEEDWWLWAGRAAPVGGVNYMCGAGPMHGRYLQVTVYVPGAATSGMVLQYFNIFGSPRTMPYSDWRQNGTQVNPSSFGITVTGSTGGTGFDNILGTWSNITVPASQSYWVPLGMYAGPCFYELEMFNTTAGNDPIIAAANTLTSGQIVPGTACPNLLVNFANTSNLNQTGTFIAPRAPTFFVIKGGSSGTTLSFNVIAQQSA